jgi:hypothetical protein
MAPFVERVNNIIANNIHKLLPIDEDLSEPRPVSMYKGTYFTTGNMMNTSRINDL